jgi:hypothetical protein
VIPIARACVCDDYFTVDSATGELCLKAGTMGLRDILYFGTPGTYQFRKGDYPWLARVRVIVQGAGGGSAGADADAGECIARPGGSGGGWSSSLIEVSALGTSETIVVGAGGAGGVGNNSGNSGGASSFGGFAIAPGGAGGTATMVSGTTPDAASGVVGPAGGTGDDVSGGGFSHGAIRLSGNRGLSGAGGDSRLGHGGGGRASEGGGTVTRGRGGGGGGALSYGGAVNGAEGGDGIVIVELYG